MQVSNASGTLLVSFQGDLENVGAGTFMAALGADMEILSVINRVLSQSSVNIDVRVGAPRRGSFEFLIHVVGIGIAVPGLFGLTGLEHVQNVIKTFIDIHGLKRFLGGKSPASTNVAGDQIRVKNHFGDSMTFTNNVFNIYESDRSVDGAIVEKFMHLAQEPSITGLLLEGAKKPFNVSRSDFPLLLEPRRDLAENERVITERTFILPASWITEGEAAWIAYRRGKRIHVYLHKATMNEHPFYDFIRESVIRFGVGDLMDVELEERQMLNETTGGYETRSIWVTKVHRYIPRDEQGNLPLEE